MGPVELAIKKYIVTEFLNGEDPHAITESTPLVTSRILDSMAILRLVLFLELEFSVSMNPQEIVAENLDTINKMAKLVHSKSI